MPNKGSILFCTYTAFFIFPQPAFAHGLAGAALVIGLIGTVVGLIIGLYSGFRKKDFDFLFKWIVIGLLSIGLFFGLWEVFGNSGSSNGLALLFSPVLVLLVGFLPAIVTGLLFYYLFKYCMRTLFDRAKTEPEK